MNRVRITLISLAVCAALLACNVGKGAPTPTRAASVATQAPAATATVAADTPTAPPAAAPSATTAPAASPTPNPSLHSDDGRAELLVPPGALPAGVSPSDIHIVAVDPATSRVTSDGQPAQAIYSFKPDGLVFTAPAQFSVTLPLPANRRLPLMLSLSNGKAEWLGGVQYTLDADAGKLTVSATVNHFSSVSLVLGFFTATIADPPSQQLDKAFNVPVVVARVRTVISTTTEAGDVFTTTNSALWTLTGKLSATRTLAPRSVAQAPAKTEFTTHMYSTNPSFTCKTAGAAGITYDATLNAETSTGGIETAPDYPIKISTAPFKCLAAGETASVGSAQPPALTHFKAVFTQAAFSTFYEVSATDTMTTPLKYYWSLSEICGSFKWDSTGASPKATWVHPHPPCPQIKGDHPGQITVRVVNGAGLESVYIYDKGSSSGDLDLTKPAK